MTDTADINHHLLQISEATVAAKAGFDGAKSNRQALLELAAALCAQLDGITQVLTGSDYLESYAEKFADDINVSFDLAAELREVA